MLVRHGETAWSKSGQHTGRTDIALTETGEQQGRSAGAIVRSVLAGATPARVLSSPRQRAVRTAELAGFPPNEVTEALAEWDYGDLEGRTSAQIHAELPGWTIWRGPVPGGEDADAITARLDGLLKDIAGDYDRAPVVLFSHGHACRCLAARWLGEPITFGRYLALGTGAVSVLGFEHDRPVLVHWNLDAVVTPSTVIPSMEAPA
jgi:probable phosphoglycerate mutase